MRALWPLLAALLAATTLEAADVPKRVLWRDPGAATRAAPAPPKPPFVFLREDESGTQPKLFARDASGATWDVKFGNEVKTESFCWRVAQACGYFAEPSFFVAEGRFEGFRQIRRSTPSLLPDGRFKDARFQFRDPKLKFLTAGSWRWDRPPWAGTKELSGLKILIMLFSNWDNKDARAGTGGSNTAVFETRENGRTEHIYSFTDWGSGMGSWGPGTAQTDWRCADYAAQTPGFAKRVGNRVEFAWEGAINEGFKTGIPVEHVAWLIRYLGHITDAQLRADLKAGGGTEADAECFTKAIRSRIEQLKAIAGPISRPAAVVQPAPRGGQTAEHFAPEVVSEECTGL